MPSNFKFAEEHIITRLQERYKFGTADAKSYLHNVGDVLSRRTPVDWRFTESPTSRFFVMEEEKAAKFLGMSYRASDACSQITQELQELCRIGDSKTIISKLKNYSSEYLSAICSPDLPIVHEFRTVYGKGSDGNIREEKQLYETGRGVVAHILPVAAKKIASRPNAIVSCNIGDDGHRMLLVRQHLNWINMEPGKKEYYLFHPLTDSGIDNNQLFIYSLTENGDLKKEDRKVLSKTAELEISPTSEKLGKTCRSSGVIPDGYRTESYWKVPTCLDIRLTDLDYLERSFDKLDEDEDIQITNEERTELFFLRKIVETVKNKIK